jgi:hypothetical protein
VHCCFECFLSVAVPPRLIVSLGSPLSALRRRASIQPFEAGQFSTRFFRRWAYRQRASQKALGQPIHLPGHSRHWMGAAQAALSLVFGSEAEDKRNKAGVRLSSATAVAVAERVSSIFNLLSKSSPLLWHRQPDSVCFTATDRKEEEAFL